MKLLSAQQIRQWDQFTIQHEPVSSIQLMERAAKACARWILQNTLSDCYYIFCGKGNNGGDGLAIARLLSETNRQCKVFILDNGAKGSEDYTVNFNHLHQSKKVPIILIRSENDFPEIPSGTIIIDSLFGTGLYKKLEGNNAALVEYLNSTGNAIISIDMPSGMLADESSVKNVLVKAHHTITFQCLKMAFLLAENEPFFGQVHILDINLHPDFIDTIETRFKLVNKARCQSVFKPRRIFAHKGDFGHAMIIAGSFGKMGAAVLSAKACMKSGAGLLTCHVPECGIDILQTSVPEAMCIAGIDKKFVTGITEDLSMYNAIGIGPGLGSNETIADVLKKLIADFKKPIVFDADALNVLATHPDILQSLPENSILTPHPKEFSHLFGDGLNDYQKIETAISKAVELKVIIVLKGHYTFIATPAGNAYFNITGNAGMATGGAGDVLTGILTGLIAQGYIPEHAAILGVFLHGLAGDLAAGLFSMEAITAGDIIGMIGKAYKAINDE